MRLVSEGRRAADKGVYSEPIALVGLVAMHQRRLQRRAAKNGGGKGGGGKGGVVNGEEERQAEDEGESEEEMEEEELAAALTMAPQREPPPKARAEAQAKSSRAKKSSSQAKSSSKGAGSKGAGSKSAGSKASTPRRRMATDGRMRDETIDEDAMDAGRVTVDTIWLESLGVVPRLMRRCAGDLIARVSPPPTQLPSDTCGFLLTPA